MPHVVPIRPAFPAVKLRAPSLPNEATAQYYITTESRASNGGYHRRRSQPKQPAACVRKVADSLTLSFLHAPPCFLHSSSSARGIDLNCVFRWLICDTAFTSLYWARRPQNGRWPDCQSI
jgi:hypothetical protein